MKSPFFYLAIISCVVETFYGQVKDYAIRPVPFTEVRIQVVTKKLYITGGIGSRRDRMSPGKYPSMIKSMMHLSVLIGMLLPSRFGNSQHHPLEVVPTVDLTRYAGTWYEIARLPNRFQKQCIGDVTATYTLLDDGQIKVVNRCRNENGEIEEAEGRARRKSDDEPLTKLEVRFAPSFLSFLSFVWGNYWIIDLAPDYSYAAVGEPGREYLWILARAPQMDDETYRGILSRLEKQDYDVSRLIRTKQGI